MGLLLFQQFPGAEVVRPVRTCTGFRKASVAWHHAARTQKGAALFHCCFLRGPFESLNLQRKAAELGVRHRGDKKPLIWHWTGTGFLRRGN